MKYLVTLLLFCSVPLFAKSSQSLKALYSSLDPLSLSQHLAFYDLYPDSPEGKKALACAWKLLQENERPIQGTPLPPFGVNIQSILSVLTKQPSDPAFKLSDQQLDLIDKISAGFANRKLKGSTAWSEEEVLALPSQEIDLARALLIAQFQGNPDITSKTRQYEASLDLMALQIRARLPKNASAQDKVREISRFIFQEMQFRFPPHSIHAKDIDLYTFLPSVMDNRQGVCLGVSILYLSIAQRLDLNLEIITPPGHIYIRLKEGEEITNIETTARGINIPSENYLGINTRSLQQRTLKEVIGMAFMNQASVFLSKGDYPTTVTLYERGLPYLPDDPLFRMFLGFAYLFTGQKSKALEILKPLQNITFDHAVSPETLPSDYLSGRIDADGIKAIFLSVDETRASIVQKQEELKKILSRYPKFRAGLIQLATTYLQLNRGSEALETLLKYHKIDSNDATVEYYLSAICVERMDYNRSWQFLKRADNLVSKRGHRPRALRAVRQHLRCLCPEP